MTDEFEVLNTGGTGTRRPDVVCFVNGIPLAVIEAKRPDPHNPRQGHAGARHLPASAQSGVWTRFRICLPMRSCCLRSTGSTDAMRPSVPRPGFWALWRDEDLDEAVFQRIKNAVLSPAQKQALFGHRPQPIRDYFERPATAGRAVTERAGPAACQLVAARPAAGVCAPVYSVR